MSERPRNRRRLLPLIPVMLGVVVGRAIPAHADGAFPASQAVLLPRDRPQEIILATTFGLLVTEDDGATWQYVCETDTTTSNAGQYIVGPPPGDRIYAVSDWGAPVTGDDACTWMLGAGPIAEAQSIVDVFPDPSDASRAFAIASFATDGGDSLMAVYRSTDGGLTYSGPLFTAPVGFDLQGIEVAASAPEKVYATFYERNGVHPRLARSDDGGDSWTTSDIEPGVGSAVPFLAGVDPTDPETLYLRISSAPGEANAFQGLAITTDGGATWTVPLLVQGQGAALVGFARRPDGSLLAVGSLAGPTLNTGVPTIFRSDVGRKIFTSESLSFHPVGLGQRDGTLFVAANNFVDGFALASSDDGGKSWNPRMRFRDVAGIKACVFSSCQQRCDLLAGTTLFAPGTCNPGSRGRSRDARRSFF